MTQKAFIFVLLALVIAGGIYFFSQNRADEPETSEEVYADSVTAPEQPSLTARNDTNDNSDTTDTTPTPTPEGEKIAPGTAMIRSTVLSVARTEDLPGKISIRVDEVLGYGPSTPPINTGTELSFDVRSYLKSNPEYKSLIQEGSEVKILIASRQGMQMGESDSSTRWALVEIKQ